MSSLRRLDLHFTIRVAGAAPDLPFLGPTVRGLLGYGLRQSCCGHTAGDDGRCPFADACAYAFLFEGPLQQRLAREGVEVDALPQPFVPLVAPPAAPSARGNRIRFGIRLIGSATTVADKVATAILARERHGFGARSSGFRLESVAVAERGAWCRADDPYADQLEEAVRRAAVDALAATPTAAPLLSTFEGRSTLRWTFVTPVALGAPLAKSSPELAARRVVEAAIRRAWLLGRAYGEDPGLDRPMPRAIGAEAFTTIGRRLESFRCARRSTRHGRTVVLHGEVGHLDIEGPWARLRELVDAASAFGIGSHTSFGFGRLTIGAVPQPPQARAARPPSAVPASIDRSGGWSVDEPRRGRSNTPRWVRLRGTPPPRRPLDR